jgi:hypothetical protein
MMPTPDGEQFKPMYHGTGGEIEGGIVRPGANQAFGPGAYATSRKFAAEIYAATKAREQNRLFGTVYEVGPHDDGEDLIKVPARRNGYPVEYYRDPKGLKVKKAVSFPINPSLPIYEEE